MNTLELVIVIDQDGIGDEAPYITVIKDGISVAVQSLTREELYKLGEVYNISVVS